MDFLFSVSALARASAVPPAQALSASPAAATVKLWFISFKVKGSNGTNGWRARVFILAAECLAYYYVDMNQSVHYEGNDLILKLLFKPMTDVVSLGRSYNLFTIPPFSLIIPLEIVDEMHLVEVDHEPLLLQSDHNDTKPYDSPPHSFCVRDYA